MRSYTGDYIKSWQKRLVELGNDGNEGKNSEQSRQTRQRRILNDDAESEFIIREADDFKVEVDFLICGFILDVAAQSSGKSY
jgi:hypothetical protein